MVERTDELTALRARVAEVEGQSRPLRHALMRIGIVASKRSLGPAEKEVEIVGICCAALNGEPTPDPRDARIAALEDAVHDACAVTLRHRLRAGALEKAIEEGLRLIGEAQQDAYWRTIERAKDVLERALGDDHG